jgi:hypothetical protein
MITTPTVSGKPGQAPTDLSCDLYPLIGSHSTWTDPRGPVNAAAERLLFPPPWDLVCIGYPKARAAGFRGLPEDIILGPLHSWQLAHSDETLHASLCMLLRTTRARTFEKRKADWRKQNKRRRASGHRTRTGGEAPSDDVLQFPLATPRRSDYRDIDAFIPGGRQPYHARNIQQALTTIVSATLALFEGLIAHVSGPEVLGDAGRVFVNRVGTAGGAAVSQRVLR